MVASSVRFAGNVPLDAEQRATLSAALLPLATLDQVVRWGLAQQPARLVSNVVTQDEYSLDVCLALADDLVVVFDTT